MATGSILKMMNTTAKTEVENASITRKHLKYILRDHATTPDLVWLNMVDKNDVFGSFGFFAKVAGKNSGRPLKHIVISYSTKEAVQLEWKEYFAATKEIAQFYAQEYQMVAAVHQNIAHRPHAHIIMDCFNVATEKKYSEGIHELKELKDFTDQILQKYKIPKLQRRKQEPEQRKERQTISPVASLFPESDNLSLYYTEGFLKSPEPIQQKDEITKEIRAFMHDGTVDLASSCFVDARVYEEIYDFFIQEPEKTKDKMFNFKNLLRGF